jgi:hypothetical protein
VEGRGDKKSKWKTYKSGTERGIITSKSVKEAIGADAGAGLGAMRFFPILIFLPVKPPRKYADLAFSKSRGGYAEAKKKSWGR